MFTTWKLGPLAIDTLLLSFLSNDVVWSASILLPFFFRVFLLDEMQCDGQMQKRMRKMQQIRPNPAEKWTLLAHVQLTLAISYFIAYERGAYKS